MRDVSVFLADLAFLNHVCGILEHSGPLLSLPQCFSCQGSNSDMVATNSLVNFSEYIVSIFDSHVF